MHFFLMHRSMSERYFTMMACGGAVGSDSYYERSRMIKIRIHLDNPFDIDQSSAVAAPTEGYTHAPGGRVRL